MHFQISVSRLLPWILASVVLSCKGGGGAGAGDPGAADAPTITVAVEPAVTYVSPGTSARFTARVTGTTNTAVRWAVDEGAEGGAVDDAGQYQAPGQSGSFHVRATSAADQRISGAALVVVSLDGGNSGPCAAAPLRTTGTVYYYCDCQSGAAAGCVAGNDASAGTSPAAPRRSFADAVERFNAMNAGDTVAFCRGGAFPVDDAGYLRNPRCTAASNCDFRDYSPPGAASGAARPIFHAGAKDFVWVNGGGIRKEGYRFWNLDVRHANGSGYTFWINDQTTDLDICNVSGDAGNAAIIEQQHDERITIRNSQWSNYSGTAILAGSNDLLVDSNVITDSGVTDSHKHVLYLMGTSTDDTVGYQRMRVVNNDIRLTGARHCSGVVIANGGRTNGTLYENNRISVASADGGCFGMGIGNGGYDDGCFHKGLIIRRNRLAIAGGEVGISISNCVDCRITDNSIALVNPSLGSSGITAPNGAARSDVTGELQNTGTVIQNNSIYVAAQGTGVSVKYEGSGYVVENNATWTNGYGCYTITQPTLRDSSASNYCRTSGGVPATSLWTDPAGGDLTLAPGSPLIGYGSSSHYSPTALSAAWSTTDLGLPRAPPIDAGAFIH